MEGHELALQERTIDRSGWGKGAWDDEPDRAEWRDTATMLPCLARRSRVSGSWCGYVAVPPGHPWHGTGYSEIDADVHGGLTYADACSGDICHVPRNGEPADVWWLGFDCAHAGDLSPGLEARMDALMASSPFHSYFLDDEWRDEYRTLGYVREQCARLAAQVQTLGGRTIDVQALP